MRDMMAQIRDVGDGIRGGTYTMTAPVITGGTITGVALTGNTFTSPVISGGSINNTPIGATTANTGAFSTLSATGVTTVQAGSAAAPAITTTGDTNTGIFFPAADTIAFSEGGVEAMRLDASGNLGIGTSSPASTAGRNITIGGVEPVLVLNASSNRSYSIASGGNFSFTPSSLVFYDNTASAARMSIDSSGNLSFNSGYGSVATAYGCRAWVNFDGTGTVAIRASGNVSSITDNGTGSYTINLATSMPDANYAAVAMIRADTDYAPTVGQPHSLAAQTASAISLKTGAYNSAQDSSVVTVAFFR